MKKKEERKREKKERSREKREDIGEKKVREKVPLQDRTHDLRGRPSALQPRHYH